MCDAPSPEQLIKIQRRMIDKLKSEKTQLKGFIQMALDELGVPNKGYPAPVSNAVDYLNQALERRIKMRASVLLKELQNIIENEGDLDIDISVAKQPEIKAVEQQQYLKAEARFVVVEGYENEDPSPKAEKIIKRISIRDWPY